VNRTRIIEIDSCKECPYFDADLLNCWCNHPTLKAKREINDKSINKIQEWCMLDYYPFQKDEKYQKMWEELEPFKEILVTADCFISKYGKESLGMKMYRLEQKYFPKETNQDIKKAINESN